MIEPDGQGGLAHFAYEMCQALAAEGHHVRLITAGDYELLHFPHTFAVEASMRLWRRTGASTAGFGVISRITRLVRRSWRGVKLTVEWMRVIWRLVRDPPDVVLFSEMLYPHLLFAPLALSLRGVTVAQICHELTGPERDQRGGGIHRHAGPLRQLMARQFDAVFFLSEAARSAFHADFDFPREKTLKVPHGSQSVFSHAPSNASRLRQKLGLEEHEAVVLFFGSIRPYKGLDELVEAFARCKSRYRARLLVAGRPHKFAELGELADRISDLGLKERVILNFNYIPLEDVAEYFELARVVALPYRSATQSGVLHLAYGFGKPVIATDVGGLSEDVIHGETGLLVPQADIAALAGAIDALCNDEAAAVRMGERARHLSQTEFTWTEAARLISGRISAVRSTANVPGPRIDQQSPPVEDAP